VPFAIARSQSWRPPDRASMTQLSAAPSWVQEGDGL
jgi:hypothetical protein